MSIKKAIHTATLIGILLLSCTTAYSSARQWELDKAHASIYFTVDHIFSKVLGQFRDFTLELAFDPADLSGSSLAVTIPVDSIDTGIPKRDKHLLSADFFDSKKFPEITFTSTAISDAGDGLYDVAGTLTIKGQAYNLLLPLKLAGMAEHPAKKGTEVAGFNGSIVIDRLAHGVGNGKFHQMGIVGKDVEVFVTFEVLDDKS